jgi:hypothetical protein
MIESIPEDHNREIDKMKDNKVKNMFRKVEEDQKEETLLDKENKLNIITVKTI